MTAPTVELRKPGCFQTRGIPEVWGITSASEKHINTWEGLLGQCMEHATLYPDEGQVFCPEDEIDRLLAEKTREGFLPLSEWGKPSDIRWEEPMPDGLRFYRPGPMDPDLERKLLSRHAWLTRIRTGLSVVVVVAEDGGLDWHTDEMDAAVPAGSRNFLAPRVERVSDALNRLQLPPGTVLLGDLVCDSEDDGFEFVDLVMTSTVYAACRMQQEQQLALYVWDIPFYAKYDWVLERTYYTRWGLMEHLFGTSVRPKAEFIRPVQLFHSATVGHQLAALLTEQGLDEDVPHSTKDQALRYAQLKGWAGFAVIDPSKPYGKEGWCLHGMPERPAALSKLLVDSVIRDGEWRVLVTEV